MTAGMISHDAEYLNFFRRMETENGDLAGVSHAFFGKTQDEIMMEEDLARLISESDGVEAKELHRWLDANSDGQVCERDFDEKVLKPLFAEQLSERCTPHCNFLALMAKELPRERRANGMLDCLAGLEEDDIEDCVNRALPAFVTAFASLCAEIRAVALQTPIASAQSQEDGSECDDEDEDEAEAVDLGEFDQGEGEHEEEEDEAREDQARARATVREEGETAGGETDISTASTVVNGSKAGSARKEEEQDEDDSFRDIHKTPHDDERAEVLAGANAGGGVQVAEDTQQPTTNDAEHAGEEAEEEAEVEGMVAKHDWRLKRLRQHQRNIQRLLEAALEVVSEEMAEQLLVDATLEASQAAQELEQVVTETLPVHAGPRSAFQVEASRTRSSPASLNR